MSRFSSGCSSTDYGRGTIFHETLNGTFILEHCKSHHSLPRSDSQVDAQVDESITMGLWTSLFPSIFEMQRMTTLEIF